MTNAKPSAQLATTQTTRTSSKHSISSDGNYPYSDTNPAPTTALISGCTVAWSCRFTSELTHHGRGNWTADASREASKNGQRR